MRTGAQYRSALADDRCIFVDGERVRGVCRHEAFRGITSTISSLYDTSVDPSNGMVYTNPETGVAANKAFMIPRSRGDLQLRREAISVWARMTHGLVGRGPDHVGGFLAGFASAPDFFHPFGENITAFYRRLIEEDLFVTYVIVPPQVDRSKTAHERDEALSQVRVCGEKDGGIVVSGAQMLGTSTTICDHLLVSCIVPLTPGDEDYALSFVVPASTPGLKLYCRPPYALGKSSAFDYPLSTHFDETDALTVFDKVFVPWEQVFVYRDVQRVKAQFHETPAHVLGNTQAQIRLIAKMKLILGLARKIAAVNRIDGFPGVQEKLGELASLAAIVEGMVLAAESSCRVDERGTAWPNPRFLYGAMGLQAELYPRAIHLLRELAGGGVVQVPSSYKDLLNPETESDIKRYIRSPGVRSEDRVKLFKLAWDLIGTEFGSRHQQYEMFYAGAPFVAKGYCYKNYGYEETLELVDNFLQSYDLETGRKWTDSAVSSEFEHDAGLG